MSWNLKGSYVETCSCELMCPCNLSFDHGATYEMGAQNGAYGGFGGCGGFGGHGGGHGG